jgi:gamma-glutamyltranspeptidase/glutathione hydrolase
MDFDWQLPTRPGASRSSRATRSPTSQPLAVQAGLAMLQRGGCAVDARSPAAITLTVVEPCSNGIGSDLFAILWDGRELIGLNASGRAPGRGTPAR